MIIKEINPRIRKFYLEIDYQELMDIRFAINYAYYKNHPIVTVINDILKDNK